MFIGYFPERPYQDPQPECFGATGTPIKDLTLSNGVYDAELSASLYNHCLNEKISAEEMGFPGTQTERAPQHAVLHGRRYERRSLHPANNRSRTKPSSPEPPRR